MMPPVKEQGIVLYLFVLYVLLSYAFLALQIKNQDESQNWFKLYNNSYSSCSIIVYFGVNCVSPNAKSPDPIAGGSKPCYMLIIPLLYLILLHYCLICGKLTLLSSQLY